ncbi:uncharacterized protein [Nicotiana tomentosiformis]|uniref:uncharacterized protein n=1 Tax=Nicotiana tomentosiformis TaxID=4098 RepID=UPI00388C8AAB
MDPLKYIFQKPMPTGRLAKWQIPLTEFDIVYVTRTSMKAQALVDHLAENPVDDEYQPLSTYFPDEEVNSVEVILEDTNAWKMFFDGAVNAKGVGIGAILVSPTGQHYLSTAQLRYYPRVHYELADALATLASMLPYPGNVHINPLEIQIQERHDYCNTIEIEPDVQPWYHDIKRFLKTKKYTEQASGDQKRTIRRLASCFFLSGEILYKRTPDLNLLRCVDALEAEKIMNEVHSGVCGTHMNGYVLPKKILRAGYYWIIMEKDCFNFVRKCHQFQIHGDLIHASPSKLHPMLAPWPFVAWGMDVMGPIKPKASNRHKFILVAIDYFTKWVEAVTFKTVTKKAVVDLVHSNIICRFGISKTIITDNAANLNSHLMREVCEQFKITHRNSTPYRPKVNGVVEAANKNIKKILRKIIQSSRQWHEKLPFALLGYRTTVRTSVGTTPYLLVYGTEAVIPAEVEIPSLRIIVEAEIEDDEWVKAQLEKLTMIDEKRMAVVCHGQLYQQRMARAYNKKVRPRKFKVGQLVLRRILPHHEEEKGKFAPNWKGPYIIRKLLPKGVLYLGDIQGNDPETAVNADAVKRKQVQSKSNLARSMCNQNEIAQRLETVLQQLLQKGSLGKYVVLRPPSGEEETSAPVPKLAKDNKIKRDSTSEDPKHKTRIAHKPRKNTIHLTEESIRRLRDEDEEEEE